MSKPSAAIRTPGEEPPVVEEVEQPLAPSTVGMTMEERFAVMESTQAALVEENARLKASVQDIARSGPRASVVPVVDLPHAASFTLAKQSAMTGAAMTREGWVVPSHLGSSPVLHELQKLGLSGMA